RAQRRADRVRRVDPAVPLVDVPAVEHRNEVDAETGEQRSESGAGLRELPIDQTGDAKGERQSERQRRAGVYDRCRAAEGVEKKCQDADECSEDVDDDVLANEVRVADGDLVSAGMLDLRQG